MSGESESAVRRQMCEIGRRLYERGFVQGNDGNLSVRLAANRVVCTPTLISKGFMQPDDLCVVDMEGGQLEGTRRRTSEILMHLEIYGRDENARAVVHCHAPHATAFAILGQEIPTGILPEAEIMLGVVPTAPYVTPGTPEFASEVGRRVPGANAMVLSHHGIVSWANDLERAFWIAETLDGYCRVLLLARQAGTIGRLPEAQVRELLALREKFGAPPDPRMGGAAPLFVNPGFGR